MTYAADFKKANDIFLKAIGPGNPSEVFKSHWRDNKKLTDSAKNMDTGAGDADAMGKALKIFDAALLIYSKTLETQLTKEKKDAKEKCKVPLDNLLSALNGISTSCKEFVEADAEAKEVFEKVIPEIKKRREKHLEVAKEIEVKSIDARNQIEKFIDALNKEVRTAVNMVADGKLREVAGLRIAAKGQAEKVQELAKDAQDHYDKSLQPFFAQRNMTIATVAKELGLTIPKTHKDIFTKESGKLAKIFTQATAAGTSALNANRANASSAESATDLLSQINDIADGKDKDQIFTQGAKKTVERIKVLVDKNMGICDNLQHKSLVRVGDAVKVIMTGKPEEQVAGAPAILDTLVPFCTTTIAECKDQASIARKMLDDEKQKIPGEFLEKNAGKLLQIADLQLVGKFETTLKSIADIADKLLPQAEKVMV